MLSKEVKVIAKLSSSGSVVQLVRTPPCHGGGRGFKSLPSRHGGEEQIIRPPSVYTGEIYQYVPHKHAQFKGNTRESKVWQANVRDVRL